MQILVMIFALYTMCDYVFQIILNMTEYSFLMYQFVKYCQLWPLPDFQHVIFT